MGTLIIVPLPHHKIEPLLYFKINCLCPDINYLEPKSGKK